MSRIDDSFKQAATDGRMTFMPFVTAGDPNLETTAGVLKSLAAQSVDLIELGFPYSDPIADGPVIQASYTRALDNGLTVDRIFEMMDQLPTDEMPPILAMVSFAIIFRFGVTEFAERAAKAGFAGLIVPDLPAEEAESAGQAAQANGLDLVQLVAPTTKPERLDRVLSAAHGFVYCISVAGTTGARTDLPPELAHQLHDLRSRTTLPLAVGFGISRVEQVRTLAGVADGIIVGSAIVRLMAEADSPENAARSVGEFAADMVAECRATKPGHRA